MLGRGVKSRTCCRAYHGRRSGRTVASLRVRFISLDLAIGPGMAWLEEPTLDVVLLAGMLEGLEAAVAKLAAS